MKYRIPLLVLLLVLALLTLLVGSWLHGNLYREGASEGKAAVRVEIPTGTSVRGAGRVLQQAGLLDHDWKLRLVHRLQGSKGTVKAGTYEILPGSSPSRILQILEEGRVLTIAVTLPEGWTLDRTCAQLALTLDLDEEKLLALSHAPSDEWVTALALPEGAGLEGYLFPETYRFAEGILEEEVLATLMEHFTRAFDDSLRLLAEEQGFTMHEVVTLASIIEAETGLSQERTKVAAVYRNRLDRDWKLEADPTVAYAAGITGDQLTYRHLEMDSPYNTYRVKGLPPGPIGSPGLASLLAALHPQADFDALYFVADGEGGHAFSRTWEEHSAAVRAYRAKQRAAGRR